MSKFTHDVTIFFYNFVINKILRENILNVFIMLNNI